VENQLAKNKETVKAFYDLAFNQNKPAEAIEKYTGATYIQHNPGVADGKQGFIDYFSKMAREYPGKKLFFEHLIAEENFVVVHTCQEWPGDNDWATIDIFRLDDQGKIVEHWDTVQRVPDETKNQNGMF
jgi:predicted SnoaL-like aldol condensation-catalyzing enzyme